MEAWNVAKQNKLSNMKLSLMNEYERINTHRPEINNVNTSKSISRKPLVDRIPDILDDQEKHLEQKRKFQAENRIDNELVDCTFTPRINRKESDRSRTQITEKRQRSTTPGQKNSKKQDELINWGQQRDLKMASQRQQKCNKVGEMFKPEINKKSNRIFTEGGNGLPVFDRQTHQEDPLAKNKNIDINYQDGTTFNPQINNKSRTIIEKKRHNERDESNVSNMDAISGFTNYNKRNEVSPFRKQLQKNEVTMDQKIREVFDDAYERNFGQTVVDTSSFKDLQKKMNKPPHDKSKIDEKRQMEGFYDQVKIQQGMQKGLYEQLLHQRNYFDVDPNQHNVYNSQDYYVTIDNMNTEKKGTFRTPKRDRENNRSIDRQNPLERTPQNKTQVNKTPISKTPITKTPVRDINGKDKSYRPKTPRTNRNLDKSIEGGKTPKGSKNWNWDGYVKAPENLMKIEPGRNIGGDINGNGLAKKSNTPKVAKEKNLVRDIDKPGVVKPKLIPNGKGHRKTKSITKNKDDFVVDLAMARPIIEKKTGGIAHLLMYPVSQNYKHSQNSSSKKTGKVISQAHKDKIKNESERKKKIIKDKTLEKTQKEIDDIRCEEPFESKSDNIEDPKDYEQNFETFRALKKNLQADIEDLDKQVNDVKMQIRASQQNFVIQSSPNQNSEKLSQVHRESTNQKNSETDINSYAQLDTNYNTENPDLPRSLNQKSQQNYQDRSSKQDLGRPMSNSIKSGLYKSESVPNDKFGEVFQNVIGNSAQDSNENIECVSDQEIDSGPVEIDSQNLREYYGLKDGASKSQSVLQQKRDQGHFMKNSELRQPECLALLANEGVKRVNGGEVKNQDLPNEIYGQEYFVENPVVVNPVRYVEAANMEQPKPVVNQVRYVDSPNRQEPIQVRYVDSPNMGESTSPRYVESKKQEEPKVKPKPKPQVVPKQSYQIKNPTTSRDNQTQLNKLSLEDQQKTQELKPAPKVHEIRSTALSKPKEQNTQNPEVFYNYSELHSENLERCDTEEQSFSQEVIIPQNEHRYYNEQANHQQKTEYQKFPAEYYTKFHSEINKPIQTSEAIEIDLFNNQNPSKAENHDYKISDIQLSSFEGKDNIISDYYDDDEQNLCMPSHDTGPHQDKLNKKKNVNYQGFSDGQYLINTPDSEHTSQAHNHKVSPVFGKFDREEKEVVELLEEVKTVGGKSLKSKLMEMKNIIRDNNNLGKSKEGVIWEKEKLLSKEMKWKN